MTKVVISIFLALLSVEAMSSETQFREQALNPRLGTTTVPQILGELGEKYDKIFTIEEVQGEMGQTFHQPTQKPLPKGNIFAELDQLKQSVPHFTYRVDNQNPQIIHVIDERLARQQGYALESVINNINFTGTVYELIAFMEEQGIPVTTKGMVMDIQDAMIADFRTRVHAQGRKLKVRNILSNFIPMSGRTSRVLWVSQTNLGKSEKTYVLFHGAVQQPRTNH